MDLDLDLDLGESGLDLGWIWDPDRDPVPRNVSLLVQVLAQEVIPVRSPPIELEVGPEGIPPFIPDLASP